MWLLPVTMSMACTQVMTHASDFKGLSEAEDTAAAAQAWLMQFQMQTVTVTSGEEQREVLHPLMCDVHLTAAAIHASKFRRSEAVDSLNRAIQAYTKRFSALRQNS